jgi:hypothetical protein
LDGGGNVGADDGKAKDCGNRVGRLVGRLVGRGGVTDGTNVVGKNTGNVDVSPKERVGAAV